MRLPRRPDMALTAAEQKEIRAVCCDMAREGRSEAQIQQQREALTRQFEALKTDSAKPSQK